MQSIKDPTIDGSISIDIMTFIHDLNDIELVLSRVWNTLLVNAGLRCTFEIASYYRNHVLQLLIELKTQYHIRADQSLAGHHLFLSCRKQRGFGRSQNPARLPPSTMTTGPQLYLLPSPKSVQVLLYCTHWAIRLVFFHRLLFALLCLLSSLTNHTYISKDKPY